MHFRYEFVIRIQIIVGRDSSHPTYTRELLTHSVHHQFSGGEGGIRTLGTALQPYIGLANRRTRPLCDLSMYWSRMRQAAPLHAHLDKV
jgi:hypothetical protein